MLFVFGWLLLFKLTVLDGESSNSIWVRLMVGICVRGRYTVKEEVGDQGGGQHLTNYSTSRKYSPSSPKDLLQGSAPHHLYAQDQTSNGKHTNCVQTAAFKSSPFQVKLRVQSEQALGLQDMVIPPVLAFRNILTSCVEGSLRTLAPVWNQPLQAEKGLQGSTSNFRLPGAFRLLPLPI